MYIGSASGSPPSESVDNFTAVFFDDRVGKYVFRNTRILTLGIIASPTGEVQHKKFPLPDVLYFAIPQAGERVLDSLPLGIEHGAFWHDPDVCFHLVIITFTSRPEARQATADYFNADVAFPRRCSAALALSSMNAYSKLIFAMRFNSASCNPIRRAFSYSDRRLV